mgnify:CR=1 FL=1
MNTAIWDELDLFSNRDLLSRAFLSRHGSVLTEKKARQISASLTQGRQYFIASDTVGSIAKPLLAYYGVLSVCRAIILFRGKFTQEESLNGSHGLETKRWAATLGGNLGNIRELEIAVQREGTFLELLEATANVERIKRPTHDFMLKGGVAPVAPAGLPPGLKLSVGDVLGRFPELSEIYKKVFQQHGQTYSGWIGGESGDIPHELITMGVTGLLPHHSAEDFGKLFNIPANGDDHGVIKVMRDNQSLQARIRIGDNLKGVKLMPPLVKSLVDTGFETGPSEYLVWPIEGKFYPPTLARLFLLSYSLGMLGRYFPSVWMSGVTNEKDTAAFPLLTRAVALIQHGFPIAALKEFTEP